MLSVTVMILSDMVESVILEKEEARDERGGKRGRRRFGRLLRP